MSTHIVSIERDVRPASIVRARLGELELVLWRDNSDTVHVWEDRCPHRSVRLSAGRNMGEYLEGVYHGWRFGIDGTVIHVPSERGKGYPDIAVKRLYSKAAHGFIWASEGDLDIDTLHGAPLKPLHFKVAAKIVQPRLSDGFRATPWGEAECMVFGAGDDPVSAHAELSRLRRELEGAS